MSFTRGSNPSSSYLLELLGRIAPEEAKEALKEFLKGKFRSKNSSFDERKYQDILNDLVRIRNNIAHADAVEQHRHHDVVPHQAKKSPEHEEAPGHPLGDVVRQVQVRP